MEWLKDPNFKGYLQKYIGNKDLIINSVRSPSEMQTGPPYCDNSERLKSSLARLQHIFSSAFCCSIYCPSI